LISELQLRAVVVIVREKDFLTLILHAIIVSKTRLLEILIVTIAVPLKDIITLILLVEVEVLVKLRSHAVLFETVHEGLLSFTFCVFHRARRVL
jgi:hypothetical protein